jgi:hypothetical protein
MGITELNTHYCFYKSPFNSSRDFKPLVGRRYVLHSNSVSGSTECRERGAKENVRIKKMAFKFKRLQMEYSVM